ncbi:biotin-dependent carboxyltransferase family protein [Hymenobacter sp. RP-2-7]|uniref:Biotin-dependent carboxyltransferase family protein n=1 Tax=Hymenobacter polaris TaxID=2682546 RepID=A0A7Y0AGY8_9BACT|nr:biotin-dependent carboxyltransferase family protein [Hymenobacter polaris]NML67163.1 biotin-dependent carboxyltransferase family protein [Hymenobacter polaris]
MSISLIRPGLLTTVQDLGRPGYRAAGVPLGGALDAPALRLANLLVGNAPGEASLEITLAGPTLRFEAPHLLALVGADLSATLDGKPLPLGRPVAVQAGTVLAFGAARAGCRAYLALAGGLGLPPVLGSCSTLVRAALGGLHGRALLAGDVLPAPGPGGPGAALRARLALAFQGSSHAAAPWHPAPAERPALAAAPVLRALPGPEYAEFAPESQRAFWQQPFTVTPAADRMGYRLAGPPLARLAGAELLSSAVAPGTVQVPPGGQPIVLLADCQTTGGYPRLAHVIAPDLGLLAQARPGTPLRFQQLSQAEAHALYLAQEAQLRTLAANYSAFLTQWLRQ